MHGQILLPLHREYANLFLATRSFRRLPSSRVQRAALPSELSSKSVLHCQDRKRQVPQFPILFIQRLPLLLRPCVPVIHLHLHHQIPRQDHRYPAPMRHQYQRHPARLTRPFGSLNHPQSRTLRHVSLCPNGKSTSLSRE